MGQLEFIVPDVVKMLAKICTVSHILLVCLPAAGSWMAGARWLAQRAPRAQRWLLDLAVQLYLRTYR